MFLLSLFNVSTLRNSQILERFTPIRSQVMQQPRKADTIGISAATFLRTSLACLLTASAGLWSLTAFAEMPSEVIVHKAEENLRGDDHYPLELLRAAMSVTQDKYGAIDVRRSHYPMSRLRTVREMNTGNTVNVMVTPPALEWDSKTLRVQFPIARGFLSYRLFLIKEKFLPQLHAVSSLEELKEIPTGSGTHWSLTRVFTQNGFNTVLGVGDNSLVDMLKNERFITFSRGLNEVFTEHEKMKPKIPDIAIDTKYLLYTHMPTYFYVSSKHPELAERIKEGLIILHDSGELDAIFESYHGDSLRRANLKGREVIQIPNPNISPADFEHDKKYVLQLDKL